MKQLSRSRFPLKGDKVPEGLLERLGMYLVGATRANGYEGRGNTLRVFHRSGHVPARLQKIRLRKGEDGWTADITSQSACRMLNAHEMTETRLADVIVARVL